MDMTIKGNKKYNWLIVWLWWSGMTYKNRTIKETLKQVQKTLLYLLWTWSRYCAMLVWDYYEFMIYV